MTLPTNLDDALAMIRNLLQDGNLGLGIAALGLILLISAILSWVIVGKVQ